MAKKLKVISRKILSLLEAWCDETAGECLDIRDIEIFLKEQLAASVGHIVIPQDKDTDGYYHVWGFRDLAAYNDYRTDSDANAALRLFNVAIPILEDKGGVSNIVTLTRNTPASIVTSKAIANVNVSYLWQQFNPITNTTTDQDEDATIVVSCRTQNANGTWGAWDQSKEFSTNIQSGQSKTIDLSKLLTSDATYQVRLVATGETSGISASPVTLTIVYSNVSVKYEGSIATAYSGSSIQLPFRISGSANKQLKIRINGYTKNFTIGTTTYTDNTYGANLTQSEFSLLRGAVKAEVWVAFGEGFSAETEHQEFQFIFIPENDTIKTPILAVTDIIENFQNWTRTTIFNYAIYNPNANSTLLRITLQDRDTGQIYIRKEHQCVNGESYAFDENFAMEYAGDEQPNIINAQAIFTDAQGASFGNNINFTVDNSENFAPTRGANVILSPEKRAIEIDGKYYELDKLLKDPNDTNSGWGANIENDSTGEQVSVPVCSIGAGNSLTLPVELFDANTGHNNGGVEGSITIEFDLKVKNIVGDAPIVSATAPFGTSYTGLRFYPTRVVCLSRNNFTEDICDYNFLEETRQHIAVNIIRNLRGEGMNLVRIFCNGVGEREFIYTDEDAFIPIGASGAKNIVIGSDEADIDIYGIRIYKGQQLGSTQIQNDYAAGMPTIADKKTFKRFNSIFNGSEISYDQCNAMGLNTILRKIPEGGHYPSRENQSKQKDVGVDVRIFKERGNPESLDRKHSGTFTGMTIKGQGTSAKGYYWWNITDGFEDDKEIAAEEYDASNPAHYAEGGKYYKKVSYFNSLDGTSQVYVSKYELEDGRGGITKLVGKANYASPMQSHKLGAIWMYDELWQRLENNGSDERPILEGHATCYEKPFLCFYQIGNGNPVFCGFQTWGSGKGDKKTFGYDKKKSPGYLCISGADNGAIAALYQMPWIVSKNAQGAWEGNIYPKSVTINTGDIKNGYCYKAGGSDTLSFEVEIGSKYDGGETDKGVLRIEDEAKGESETTLYTHFADFANFVFSNSPLLKPYIGTEAQLIADSANLVRDHQYWLFKPGANRFKVFYFNPATAKFEPIVKVPTKWGSNGRATAYGSPKLTEQLAGVKITIDTIDGKKEVTLEEAMETLGTSDMNVLNECFIKARVANFKAHAKAYIDVPDAVFHQACIKLEAGSDNRTKNTYPWIDPTVDLLVRFKQDDLDTIKKTDNQGRQTKPYYVLEHTKDASGSNYWNGENNVLFTLIDMAYADRIRNMLRDMFATMEQICGSVDEYYQQRFYWVQEYFPAVAYNEANRLLYEVAQVKLMNGLIDVSQDPITQVAGDQLSCEKQFMAQRLPMLMSWCEYETGGDGTLSFRSVNNNAGLSPTYDIEYTAYQYIYPKLAIGGKLAVIYAKRNGEWIAQDSSEPYRCAPGETVRMVIDTDSNTQLTLRWMHYAKSIGNLGILPCGEDGNVNITGRRLRKLECWSPDGTPIEFHPLGLMISNCRNIEEIDFHNAKPLSGTFSFDLPRLRKLTLNGTGYTSVNLPKTSTLTEVSFPASINAITVDGQPNLSVLTAEGLENLRTLTITGEHKVQSQTQSLVQLAYAQARNATSVKIDNVAWTNLTVAVMMWLESLKADITGTISLSGTVTFANKMSLIVTYGAVDEATNPLYLTYTKRTLTSINVAGQKYIGETGDFQFSAQPDVLSANSFKDVQWSIESNPYATVNPKSGVLTVTQIGSEDYAPTANITVRVTLLDGDVLEATDKIGFYVRSCKLGDYVFADGSFSDILDRTKTPIGICCFIDENNPANRLAVQLQDVSTGIQWGLYFNNGSGSWAEGGSDDKNYNIRNLELADDPQYNCYDIAAITNIGSRGLYDKSGKETAYITDESFRDELYGDKDGFKRFTGNTAMADMGFVELSARLGKFKEGDVIPRSLQKTLQIIAHRNKILEDSGVNIPIPTATDKKTLMESLNECMAQIVTDNDGMTKYRQYYYPAASLCNAYEPSVRPGEVLSDKFKAGMWALPTEGILSRLYWYHRQGYETSNLNAIFARGRQDNVFTAFSAAWYWSVTEYSQSYAWSVGFNDGYTSIYYKYYSGRVRAVVAF